jgi:hypothetical protein
VSIHSDPSAELALVPKRSGQPARFERWHDAIVERSFEIWASVGARNGGRTALLLARELGEDAPLPTPSTIRRWALDGAWAAKADADLEGSHGRTRYELQVGWLAALQLAQQTLLDGMAGALDAAPHAGIARLKAAEITLRTIERAGLLAVLPQPPEPEHVDDSHLTLQEREALAQERLTAARRDYLRRQGATRAR